MNAAKMYPSIPINLANRSKNVAICVSILIPPTYIFPIIQIIIPAGSATVIALPKTNNVLSNIERISTFPICGFLYGGNSNIKDDGIPFNTVFDRILETIKVIPIPSSITNNTMIVDTIDEKPPKLFAKNMVAIVIKNGNLPLHGTNPFVNIDINLSLGESIILHPTTPAALQPNPMHIVSACFP